MDNVQLQSARLETRASERPQLAGFWYRFWKRMLWSALAFNVVAGLVTWFVLFPRLFPGH
jgi:hypothetical protein